MENLSYYPEEKVQQREAVSSRFNGIVVKELQKNFTDTHDVCRDYFTHSFPFDNLGNIVDNGGLLTPNELRRQGVDFKKGSSQSAGGTIFFAKDEIQSGYGTVESIGSGEKSKIPAAILVPRQEFQRVSRLRKDLSGYEVLAEKDYSDPEFKGVSLDEFPLTTESTGDNFAKDRADKSALEIANKLLAKKIAEAEAKRSSEVEEAEVKFQKNYEAIGTKDKTALDTLSAADYYHIERSIKKILNDKEKQKAQLGKNLAVAEQKLAKNTTVRTMSAGFHERRLESLKPGLAAKVMEKLGVKTYRMKEEAMTLGEVKADSEAKVRDEAEVRATREQMAELDLLAGQLEGFLTLCAERSTKKEQAKRKYEEEVEKLKAHYGGGLGSRFAGEGLGKIHQRMRKAYDTAEVERSAKVELERSVIIVDKSGLEAAIKATENKPGLKSRIVIYDAGVIGKIIREKNEEEKLPRMEKFLSSQTMPGGLTIKFDRLDGPNAVLRFLTQTSEGFKILTAAQAGQSTASGQEGIFTLEQYLASINQAKAKIA